jgi:hypothetical protein
MKVILPSNWFGICIMLLAIALVITVPFVLVLWLMLKVAPAYVALPLAMLASLVSFLGTVKYRPEQKQP